MNYSIRTLFIVVGLSAISLIAVQWHGRLPPLAHGHWTREFPELSTVDSAMVHEYCLGSFSANKEAFAGFIARDLPRTTTYDPDWVRWDDGCLYINGKRVMPKSDYQLFVSDGTASPTLVLLDSDDMIHFLSFKLHRLDDIPNFWQTVSKRQSRDAR